MVNLLVVRIEGLQRFVSISCRCLYILALTLTLLPGTCSERWKRMRETRIIDLILFTFDNFLLCWNVCLCLHLIWKINLPRLVHILRSLTVHLELGSKKITYSVKTTLKVVLFTLCRQREYVTFKVKKSQNLTYWNLQSGIEPG